MLDGAMPDTPDPVAEDAATALSPAASVALFIAARLALRAGQKPQISDTQERCELRTPPVRLMTLPPEEAAARLRGIWWDDDREVWRTDYPAPPGFDGEESDELYDPDDYERDLTPEEEEALALRDEEEHRPYAEAAARARDAYFGFAQGGGTAAAASAAAQARPG